MQLNLFYSEAARPASATRECTICGGHVMELNCKRLCTNCGYKEDCSDLFIEELTNESRV